MMNLVIGKSLTAGLVGTNEEVADRLLRYEQIGMEFTMLHFYPMLEGVRSFAEHVLPLMAARREATART